MSEIFILIVVIIQLKTLEDALDAKDQEVESIREETNS